MKKNYFVLTLFFINITFLFSQNTDDKILLLNQTHLPYFGNNISMYIESPVFNDSMKKKGLTKELLGLAKSELFVLSFKDNSFELGDILNSYTNNSITKEELIVGYNDIKMLLRYLNGFYYGLLLHNEMSVVKKTDSEMVFEYLYEYKGQKSRNTYLFKNNILSEVKIFKDDSDIPMVESEYKFTTKNNKHYLSEMKTINRNHGGFFFNIFISYDTLDIILFPKEFTVEISSGLNKSNFIYTTKYKEFSN